MAEFNTWTPYLAGAFAAAIAWLFKQTVQYGKDIAVIQYYVERQTEDAARRLDHNPAPPEIRGLLRRKDLTKEEREQVVAWLEEATANPEKLNPGEYGAALQMLTGLKIMKDIHPKKRWWW